MGTVILLLLPLLLALIGSSFLFCFFAYITTCLSLGEAFEAAVFTLLNLDLVFRFRFAVPQQFPLIVHCVNYSPLLLLSIFIILPNHLLQLVCLCN